MLYCNGIHGTDDVMQFVEKIVSSSLVIVQTFYTYFLSVTMTTPLLSFVTTLDC